MDQVFAACFRDYNHIFQSNSTHSFVVKSRLNGHDVSGTQAIFTALPKRWRLMNIETKSMAGSVEEPLHASIDQARRKTFTGEIIHDFKVNIVRIRVISDATEPDVLSVENAVVGMLQPIRSAAADNCSRDVAEITGVL